MRVEQLGIAALLALPGVLAVYLGFNDGGFFPSTVAVCAVLVALVLVARTMSAVRPFEGLGRGLGLALAALGLFALWILLSRTWSHAPARSTLEFDRVLLYLLALALFGSLAHTQDRMRWFVRGLAAGAAVVCLAGLVSRLLPHVIPTEVTIENDRLSYPVTYWNALGLLGAIATLLCLHLTSAWDESRAVRIASAALVPALAVTVYFTFSRGSIATGLLGVVVYLLMARSVSMIGALLAIAPTTIAALIAAYGADALASTTPQSPAGISQGHHVTLIVVACCLAAAGLRALTLRYEDTLRSLRAVQFLRLRARQLLLAVLLVLVCGFVVALAEGTVSRQYHRFVSGDAPTQQSDLRSRLTQVSNNGRTQQWRSSFDDFADEPLHGTGAGTYQLGWERRRPTPLYIKDSHSLYFETLGELGVIGLVLVVVFVLCFLVAAVRRWLRTRAPVYAGVFAAMLVWAIEAGFDWDWEMPVVTLWVFALGGALLARERADAAEPEWPSQTGRTALALAWLTAATLPASIAISEGRIGAADDRLTPSACPHAVDLAFGALDVLSDQGRAYEIVAYCDLQQGEPRAAALAVRHAIDADPDNWQYQFDLAVAQAESGVDPRPALRVARAMNPLDDVLARFVSNLGMGTGPATWRRAGASARRAMLLQGRVGRY